MYYELFLQEQIFRILSTYRNKENAINSQRSGN
jgi:hypothetical protein